MNKERREELKEMEYIMVQYQNRVRKMFLMTTGGKKAALYDMTRFKRVDIDWNGLENRIIK